MVEKSSRKIDSNTEIEFYLRLCEEEWQRARHIEEQREKVTGFVITLSVVIIGFIIQKSFSIKCIFLAILLIMLGLYGIITSLKYYERFNFQIERARIIRKFIDDKFFDSNIDKLMKKNDVNHEKKYPISKKIRLYFLWEILHTSILFVGIASLIYILLKHR